MRQQDEIGVTAARRASGLSRGPNQTSGPARRGIRFAGAINPIFLGGVRSVWWQESRPMLAKISGCYPRRSDQ
jgi:hypothetical protein